MKSKTSFVQLTFILLLLLVVMAVCKTEAQTKTVTPEELSQMNKDFANASE